MGWFDRPEFGPNVGLIDDIYRQYLDDPSSVSEAWREFFAENEPEEPEEPEERPAQADRAAPAEAETDQPARAEARAEPERAQQAAEPAERERTAADGDGSVTLRGAAAAIARAMEESRQVPTATSFRVVPARLLEVNRDVLNGHLRRRRGGKVSFTHLIGYAVVKAIQAMPAMNSIYVERDGKPHVRR